MNINNIINILPPEISEKIAAGEVVERPLSIVKELLENSIDGGAKNIIIEIKNGGKSYIRITDNGRGIPASQVENAFVRHGTSKITNLSDLDIIDSLGFRGEALTSISAVSRLEMITKDQNEGVGTRLVIEGGEILERSPVGADKGTTVIVRDVFFNLPARLKFLKSDSAEASLIIDLVSKIALAYPHIGFRLINNQNLLFSTDGRGKLYDNLLKIYENEIVKSLIEVDFRDGEYHLYGYITPPHVNKPAKSSMVNFVNGRSVKDKVMEDSIRNAYKERMDRGRFPCTFLFLRVPPAKVDANIHPNKLEIRHNDEKEVGSFVEKAVSSALNTDISFPVITMKSQIIEPVDKTEKDLVYETGEQVNIKTLLSTKREKTLPVEIEPVKINDFNFSQLKPLGSVFATYIIAISEDKMYLIDQHAAHERVIYEKFLKQYQAEDKATQMLLSPTVIELSPRATSNFSWWGKELENMGYLIENFGGRSFIIKGIPGFMSLNESVDFAKIYGEDQVEQDYEKTIAKACKAAIKANNILKFEDMLNLLEELDNTKNPYSCPHGRPTILTLTKAEVERLFKRV